MRAVAFSLPTISLASTFFTSSLRMRAEWRDAVCFASRVAHSFFSATRFVVDNIQLSARPLSTVGSVGCWILNIAFICSSLACSRSAAWWIIKEAISDLNLAVCEGRGGEEADDLVVTKFVLN